MQLRADNLTCIRGGREVFAGVSFAVSGGEALVVTGSNGAGKSSLLRVIAGLVRPVSGDVRLDDGETSDHEAGVGERSHYLGHQDAIKPSLTIAENLQFWADYFGARNEIRVALEAVGLAELSDLPAQYLSAGQKRRLSIARLVAVTRPLWLLDEPSSALDSAAQARLSAIMRDHLIGGGIIVAATHTPIELQTHELRLGTPA